MNLRKLVAKTEKALADNSPAILTGIGVAGTIAGAILSGRASIKAVDILRAEEQHRKNEVTYYREIYKTLPPEMTLPIPLWDKMKLVWIEFIPPVATVGVSVVAIIMSNRISTRRATALATAYTVLERGYSEFREKTREHLGDKGYKKVQREIAQERVDRTPGGSQVIIEGTDVLCFDGYSGRYFKSSMETLKKAQNDTNYQMIKDGYASLTDFWNRIGLDPTQESDDLGWTSDGKPLEIAFSTILSEDSRPCIYLEFIVLPMRDYWKFG